jgi:hypothetical protein
MSEHTELVLTYGMSAASIIVSILSIVVNIISSRRLEGAVKDLHESHDELHTFIKEADKCIHSL